LKGKRHFLERGAGKKEGINGGIEGDESGCTVENYYSQAFMSLTKY